MTAEPSPARPARPAHRPSRRPAILVAAQAMFVEHGPATVTIADIAGRADMTVAAVYYHFPSKAEVLQELVETIGERVVALFPPPPRRTGVDLAAWLGERHDALARWRADDAEAAALYLTASAGFSPAIEAVRRRQRREMVVAAAEAVSRAGLRRRRVEAHVIALGLLCLLLDTVTETAAPRRTVVDVGLRLAGVGAAPLAAR